MERVTSFPVSPSWESSSVSVLQRLLRHFTQWLMCTQHALTTTHRGTCATMRFTKATCIQTNVWENFAFMKVTSNTWSRFCNIHILNWLEDHVQCKVLHVLHSETGCSLLAWSAQDGQCQIMCACGTMPSAWRIMHIMIRWMHDEPFMIPETNLMTTTVLTWARWRKVSACHSKMSFMSAYRPLAVSMSD